LISVTIDTHDERFFPNIVLLTSFSSIMKDKVAPPGEQKPIILPYDNQETTLHCFLTAKSKQYKK